MNTIQACTEPSYKLRTECGDDAQAVRGLLQPWLLDWRESRDSQVVDGAAMPFSDVDVEFRLFGTALTLEELRWLIDLIPNCHVASETLQPSEFYTGERTFRRRWAEPARQPSPDVLRIAAHALDKLEARQRLQVDRTRETRGALKAALAGGAKWQDVSSDRAGWLVAISAPYAKHLTALRSICPPLGARNLKAVQKSRVADRVKTLEA